VSDLTLTTTRVGDVVVVAAEGELDFVSAPELRAALEAVSDGKRVVLDLSGLSFMDSSGLGVLVSLRQRQPELSVRVAGASPRVAQLFTLTRLDAVFPLFPTVDAATEA
jgi:anti-sigma B factor antagonist